MVARCLPNLASVRDPARHLDALPRRYEAGDTEHGNRHRSIAPTFTSVMEEIGLTRWQRSGEPFLLGLTATRITSWSGTRGRDRLEENR